jgi:hypothetical protein
LRATRLIALLLGRLRLPILKAIEVYCVLSERIFGSSAPVKAARTAAHGSSFDGDVIRKEICAIVKEATEDENAMLIEHAPSCKVYDFSDHINITD